MSGYIYCITNSQYKFDDTYKLGYTAINLPLEDAKKKLLQRYETYFVNAECMILFLVRQPIKAERRLFELLRDYNTQKELFKADYDTIIRPVLEQIKNEFDINVKLNNKDRYIGKINKVIKKIPYYSKHIRTITIFLGNQLCLMPNEKLNENNCSHIQHINSRFQNYENNIIQQSRISIQDSIQQPRIAKQKTDKRWFNMLLREVEEILNNMDYDDININIFLDNILKL